MKAKDGFEQACNCQAAVDGERQVIVPATVTQAQNDVHESPNLGRQAREVSADSGYCSEENLRSLNRQRIRGYVATGRQKHGASSAIERERGKRGPLTMRMATRLRRGGWRSRYRLRKQIVEPVSGQIQEGLGLRRCLLRGDEKVRDQWRLVCAPFNLRKLAAAMR